MLLHAPLRSVLLQQPDDSSVHWALGKQPVKISIAKFEVRSGHADAPLVPYRRLQMRTQRFPMGTECYLGGILR